MSAITLTVWLGELDAHGGRHAEAEAAAAPK